jgi:hypothetical protein
MFDRRSIKADAADPAVASQVAAERQGRGAADPDRSAATFL